MQTSLEVDNPKKDPISASALAPICMPGHLKIEEKGDLSGVVAIGGIAASIGAFILLGGLPAASATAVITWFLYGRTAKAENDRMDAIANGATAAAMPIKRLLQYEKHVGTDRVVAELLWARQSGVPLSRRHQAFLEECHEEDEHKVLYLDNQQLFQVTRKEGREKILAQFEAAIADGCTLTPVHLQFVQSCRKALGLQPGQYVSDVFDLHLPAEVNQDMAELASDITELRQNLAASKDSSVEPMISALTPSDLLTRSDDSISVSSEALQLDVVEEIIYQTRSLCFLGSQRCGKSRLMAIASQVGKKMGRFKKVFAISSLAKKGEDDHYWVHCDDDRFVDLAKMDERQRWQVYNEYIQIINAFRDSDDINPGLLILDEIQYLATQLTQANPKRNKLDRVKVELEDLILDVLSVVASGGDKRGWSIFLGAPTGAIGGMGRIGQAMKKLGLVFCAISPNSRAQVGRSQVTWDASLFAAAQINFKHLTYPNGAEARQGDLIVFLGSRWYPSTAFQLMDVDASASPPETPTPTPVVPSSASTAELMGHLDSKKYIILGLPLDREQALQQINLLLPRHGKTKTIQSLWGASPGGNNAWKEALAQYDEIVGEK